jgi:hypothetical protein
MRRAASCACGGGCPRCRGAERIQAKFAINKPGDQFEQEADRVADQVVRMPEAPAIASSVGSTLQRKCAACEQEEHETLQAKHERPPSGGSWGAADALAAPPIVHEALRSAGRPLDADTRAFMEPRFGHEFSQVRIHTDGKAAESASAVDALAYTLGRDVVFASGRYEPAGNEGRRLLAHELAHVVQQSQARVAPAMQRQTARTVCPTSISFSTRTHAVNVPACGTTPVTASARPAAAQVTWALANGATQPTFPGVATTVAAGTTISAAGAITVAPGQTPGFIAVVAGGAAGCASPVAALNFASTPVGVGATSVGGSLANTHYGAQFAQTLDSASGNPADLFHVRVNERFSGVPNPDSATHVMATPFGQFTLNSNQWTPNSDAPGWEITTSGIMGPDNIGIERSLIDVGRFVSSASNPTPATTLTPATPVGFSVQQDLHWFCPQAAVGSQWVTPPFAKLIHTRQLFQTDKALSFVTGIPVPSLAAKSDAYTGQPAIIHAAALSNPVLVSATLPRGAPRGTPRPEANTTTVKADTLPAPLAGGHGLRFSIQGPALGCRINATGVVTVGTQTGTITVRVSDVNSANHNFDEVQLAIVATLPPAPPPVPAPPRGQHLQSVPGEIAPPPPLPVLPSPTETTTPHP